VSAGPAPDRPGDGGPAVHTAPRYARRAAGGCVALTAVAALLALWPAATPYPVLASAAIFVAVFAALAGWIAVSDLRTFEIPDEANVALLLTGLFWCTLGPPAVLRLSMVAATLPGAGIWIALAAGLLDGLARCAVAAGALFAVRGLYRRLRGTDGLGLGDVKLAGAAAPWLAWSDLPTALLVAVLAALVATVGAALIGRHSLDRAAWIPLGAFLAPAAFAVWMLRLAGLPLGFAG